MSPEELDRRRPVWDALSDVFLDTETRWGMPRIAFVLVESGYSADELDAVFWNEIVPECAWNLLQVAGEWALFVVDEEKLAARADGKRPLLERMLGIATPTFIGKQWRAILAMRDALLALPAEERAARTAMWTAFIHVYVEPSLDELLFADTLVTNLRGTLASEAALDAAFENIRPIFRTLLVASEAKDEDRRARDVREVIARAARDPAAR